MVSFTMHIAAPLLSLSLVTDSASAAPTADTLAVFAALKTTYPNYLAYQSDAVKYASERDSWSGTAKDAGTSACVFYPTSANAVSNASTQLNKFPEAVFAMKSVRHSPNPGFNNVEGGLLIAFCSALANTIISADRQMADVEPGAQWQEVITTLEPYGKAVVGG